MSLADFIESNVERLVTEWTTLAREQARAVDGADPELPRRAAEALLRTIAARMKAVHSGDSSDTDAVAVSETAKQHGLDLFAGGFTLDQMVSDYGALRSSVIGLWKPEPSTGPAELLEELARLDAAVNRSLTEAVKAFKTALDRSRDIFVGVLGHDLRSPLSAAMMATELQLQAQDADSMRQATDKVRRQLRDIADLTSGLLEFVRARLGEPLPLNAEPTDLKPLCESVLAAFELSHPRAEVRLECTDDLTGTWDAVRVKQLLSNLVEHGLEDGAPLTVRAQGDADHVLLEMHDHGPPMPGGMQPLLFDPVAHPEWQEGPSPGEDLRLGLFVAKRIAEAHGGSVGVRSAAENGTTFTVRLPRAP